MLYVSAYYSGSIYVEGLPITSTPLGGSSERSSSDALLANYDAATGELRWMRHFGTGQDDLASNVKMAGGVPIFAIQPQGALTVDGELIEPPSESSSVLIRVSELG